MSIAEVGMSKKKPSENELKRREKQSRAARQRRRAELDADDAALELKEWEGGIPEDEKPPKKESESVVEDAEEVEDVEKFHDGVPMSSFGPPSGAVTFDQLDEQKAAQEKASMIREETWDVQDLVRNIVNHPMLEPAEKATFIKQAGNDFGERVGKIMDTPAKMLKEKPLEVLEIEALLAKDKRQMGFVEKHAGKLFPQKEFVRKSLQEAAQAIEKGGEEAEKALESLPELREEAKRLGISKGMEDGGKSGILIQKDAEGDWRWVGWPSNNFIDRSGDILTEKAHLEYVEWWNKERGETELPVFTSNHLPTTARTYPVDFVGYENGFLTMSGKLTEDEAVQLLRVQKDYDLGMSHTGWGIRGAEDKRLVTKYRIFEVTDLAVNRADNPYSGISDISKEAVMSTKQKDEQLDYLTKLLGSEEKAVEALSMKPSLKQAELQEAGVEQKEAKEEEPKATEKANEKAEAGLSAEDIEKISKALDMEGLSETIAELQKSAQIVPILEKVIQKQAETIQKLDESQDERLEEMISPPAFSWMKSARLSESEDNAASEKEVEKLGKGPGSGKGGWLSQATGTEPVEAVAS
jgi:hypothetical protein